MAAKRKKVTLFARLAGIAGVIGAIALLLTNVETIVTKPRQVLAEAGIVGPPVVPVTVRLAALTGMARTELIYGKGQDEVSVFQPYVEQGDMFCLRGTPMDLCPGTATPLRQPPATSIDYDADDDPLGGAWAPGIPVFDIVSLRGDGKDALLTSLTLEYRNARVDRRPYLAVSGNDDQEGTLTLVRQSDNPVASVRLRYALRAVIPAGKAREWVAREIKPGSFADLPGRIDLPAAFFTARNELKNPRDGTSRAPGRVYTLDMRAAIERAVGEPFVPYPPNAGDTDPRVIPAVMIAGARPAAGYALAPGDLAAGLDDMVMMMVGTMQVRATDGATYDSEFATPITIRTERGYGGAGVSIDNRQVMVLDPARPAGQVSKPINLLLNAASPTVRSQVAIVSKRSAVYEMRFVYGTNDNPAYMASRWYKVQTFSPPAFADRYFAARAASAGQTRAGDGDQPD